MKKFLILLILPFLVTSLYAQYCKTDEFKFELMQNATKEQIQKIKDSRDFLNQFNVEFSSESNNRTGVYIIPVVYHVIHNYGPENISRAQLENGLEILNRNLRNLNPDTANVKSEFKSIIADCEIEFRLATKDPNGNCHSGINRIASPLTNIGDHSLKSLVHWDPTKYLNIYVSNQAAGLAGHALLPEDAEAFPEIDGIVMAHSSVGNIGTSNNTRSVVLTHEVGHYLNLQHIWGGNNVPGFFYLPVGQAVNCDYDDGVDDTPNTIGWSNCNLNAQSCGSLDNVQNFMDYAYCALMLTQGQKQRMHATLNSPIAGRNNLWTEANLEFTGVLEGELCEAEFISTKRTICAGESIVFFDESYHNVQTRTWSFEGGNADNLNAKEVLVTYPNPGIYSVTLTVSDGSSNISKTKERFIYVNEKPGLEAPIVEDFENIESLEDKMWFAENRSLNFELLEAGHLSNKSIGLSAGEENEAQIALIESPAYNISQLPNAYINFRVACFTNDASNSGRLELFISTNCGQSWISRRIVQNEDLTTGAYNANVSDTNNWKLILTNNLPTQFLKEDFRVKFEYRATGEDVKLYIDKINVIDPETFGINDVSLFEIEIFPNPTSENIVISINEKIKGKSYKVYNMTGVLKSEGILSDLKNLISLKNFETGMYFVLIDNLGKAIKVIKN